MSNSFAGLMVVDEISELKRVGKHDVVEIKCTHSYSFRDNSDVEITLNLWGNRGVNAHKFLKEGDTVFAHGKLMFSLGKTGKMFLTLDVNDYQKVNSRAAVRTIQDDEPVSTNVELDASLPF